MNKILRKQKTFRSKVVGELVPKKISYAPVILTNTDKGYKTIYYKGRRVKENLQKSSFPKIHKEQRGQREEIEIAFDLRQNYQLKKYSFHHISKIISWGGFGQVSYDISVLKDYS